MADKIYGIEKDSSLDGSGRGGKGSLLRETSGNIKRGSSPIDAGSGRNSPRMAWTEHSGRRRPSHIAPAPEPDRDEVIDIKPKMSTASMLDIKRKISSTDIVRKSSDSRILG